METFGIIGLIGGLLAVLAVVFGCLKMCYGQQNSERLNNYQGKSGKRKGKDGGVWMTGIAVHDGDYGTGNHVSDDGEYFGGSSGGDMVVDTGNSWSGGGCETSWSGGGDSGGGGGSCDV